jgi:glycosyltransferase involved in cell wall biosynthesis
MEAEIWRRLATNKPNPISRWYFASQHRRMAAAEKTLSADFDGVITVSPDDSRFCKETYQLANVLGEVPTGVDTDYFSVADTTRDGNAVKEGEVLRIGFLGSMDWMPNIEAVEWFVQDIFPKIRDRHPSVEFDIIGRNPPAGLVGVADESPGINVTGTVEDVRPYLRKCALIVVPLLSGGGTRIKILEAMAMGLPIVSTEIGAEGLGLVPGKHLVIADSAKDFAEHTIELLCNETLREELSIRGRQRVEREHQWKNAADAFIAHCRTLLAAPK